jgi:hypothetical protein
MLRRTAARAFGGGGEGSDVPAARHETHRDTAVERLFGDLHHRLVELVERRNAVPDAAVPEEPEAGAEGAVQITRPQALSHGVEFSLIGPSYTCRFVNTMTGFVRVAVVRTAGQAAGDREVTREPVRDEVLSVHPYWGTFRPILKPLPLEGAGAARRARTAFCYTSAEELAEHYMDLVRGC